MKIIIDADSCPVKENAVAIAGDYDIHVLMIASVSHNIAEEAGVSIRIVESLPQEADIAIINSAKKGDIVITNDQGLASIVLKKYTGVISPDGYIFREKDIDHLLEIRELQRRLREKGIRTKGPKKRKKEQDMTFEKNLRNLIDEMISA